MRRAIVIGAGLGGLALGIRLQAAGVETTIVEARDRPGGCAGSREQDGFTFDTGPATVTDPAALRDLWALSGRDMAEDVSLLPVSPFFRLSWPDGETFDYSNDDPRLIAEIARLNPEDVAGYRDFLDYSAAVHAEAFGKLGRAAFLDLRSLARTGPALTKYEAWRSLHAIAGKFVKHERLREALSISALLIGGNPMTASALYALAHTLERESGVWCVAGGAGRLTAALAAEFARLGGVLRLGDAATGIDTLGDRATGVATASGWRGEAEMVASNADIVHSYRDLLTTSRSAQRTRARLERKRFSPSAFLVQFGIKGAWPGIPHRSILLGAHYQRLLADIFDHGVLSEELAIILDHPTVTDPSLAPEGHSAFRALVLVPHLGKFPVDWNRIGPILERRILDEIGRRLIPDIQERIVTRASYAPSDFAHDLNMHLGSAWSLEPIVSQSAYFRVHNRDPHIPNLYFVGAGTHPGAGVPAVLTGAKVTAELMLEARG
jgi:phytoene desaturase